MEAGRDRARLAGGDRGMSRRRFCGLASRYAVGAAVLPALLAACGDDEPAAGGGAPAGGRRDDELEGTPVVGDVLDFALSSDEWPGAFGFVTMRMHRGVVDGDDVWFIRTDASDESYARKQKLVFVPKLAGLARGRLSGAAYFVGGGAGDQAVVLPAVPGADGFTPAHRVHNVTWKGSPRRLDSAADVERAQAAGEIDVDATDVVINLGIVKWAGGELAVDSELEQYLGGGQLIEPPDVSGAKVTFKLHECFPDNRYIVLDHSIEPAAMMTATNFAPALHDRPMRSGATGRTNVFLNGVEGTGPMGFQPSAFDFTAGHAEWSPFWDHYAYEWKKGASPRLLTTQDEIFSARDAGELKEWPGLPDTKGEVFTVNCPVPVVAPTTPAS